MENGFTQWDSDVNSEDTSARHLIDDINTDTVVHPLPTVTAEAGEAPQTSHPDPNALIGKLFAIDHDGTIQTGTVTDVNHDGTETMIDLRMKADGATTRLVYSRFLDALAEDVHPFHGIYGHRPVNKAKGSWEVFILWGTGETTWEPLSSIWNADKLTVAQYARENGLLDTKGWRRTKSVRGDTARLAQLVRLFKASSASWDGPKYSLCIKNKFTLRRPSFSRVGPSSYKTYIILHKRTPRLYITLSNHIQRKLDLSRPQTKQKLCRNPADPPKTESDQQFNCLCLPSPLDALSFFVLVFPFLCLLLPSVAFLSFSCCRCCCFLLITCFFTMTMRSSPLR